MSLYGVIGYHVTLSEGHMIANQPIYGGDWLSRDPLRGSHDRFTWACIVSYIDNSY